LQKYLFVADTVQVVQGPLQAGFEMVPLHGPSLASYNDDVYGDDVIPYDQYHRGRIAWDHKSSTGFVALETKLSPSYLTSVIQMLYQNIAFRRFVFSWPYQQWMESRIDGMRSNIAVMERLHQLEDRSVMTHLQRVFARLQLLNERMTKCDSIVRALGLPETRALFNKDFEVQDFLRVLFDQMDSECVGTPLQGKLDALVRPLVRVRTCGKTCGRETIELKRVACWKIALQFVTEQHEPMVVPDLETGIANFLSSYETEFNCPVCKKTEVAITREELAETSQLMFVLMDRFIFFPELDRRSKLRNRIVFPQTLKLHDFLEASEVEQYKADPKAQTRLPDVQLNLSGAIVHNGVSDAGCFFSLIKPFYKEKWYMFADMDVEEVFDQKRAFDGAYGKKTYNEDDECAFLLTYTMPMQLVDVRVPSERDVPDYLIVMVREEHANRAERKRKKMMDREMIRLEIMYQDEIRDLRVHGSSTMQSVTAQAAALFGLDKVMEPTHYRLRKWEKHYKMPSETYGQRLSATVSNCRFYTGDQLMLETLRINQAMFVEYGADCLSVRVQLYDVQSNSLSAPRIVTLARRSEPLIALKRLLNAEFGVPVNEQRIFKESSGATDGPATVELLGDNEEVSYKLQVWEGVALYLEHSNAGPSEPSPCQIEVERAKNRAILTYSFEGREEKMPIDKRDRMYMFKSQVAAKEGLDMDRFKVFQVFAADVMTELKNEDQPLHELVPPSHSREVVRLRIERFVPRIAEKVELVFWLVNQGGKLESLGPAEEWRVESLVSEMKARLSARVPRLEGKFLRLRELECGGELGSILPESLSLREAVDVLYSNKHIAVEILSKPDSKKNHEIIIVNVLQARGDWTFSPPLELEIARGASIDFLYETLASLLKLDRSVLGLAKAAGSVSALDVPQLDWNPKCPSFIRVSGVMRDTCGSSPFYLRDGDVLVARDTTEKIQDLTDEKKISLMKGLLK
jgi:hypothetical protein